MFLCRLSWSPRKCSIPSSVVEIPSVSSPENCFIPSVTIPESALSHPFCSRIIPSSVVEIPSVLFQGSALSVPSHNRFISSVPFPGKARCLTHPFRKTDISKSIQITMLNYMTNLTSFQHFFNKRNRFQVEESCSFYAPLWLCSFSYLCPHTVWDLSFCILLFVYFRSQRILNARRAADLPFASAVIRSAWTANGSAPCLDNKKPRFRVASCLAPQVGLEPTTLRFIGIRRRLILPGRVQPSTFSAEGLNFCVRDGNRWDPFAIATGNRGFFIAFRLGLRLCFGLWVPCAP